MDLASIMEQISGRALVSVFWSSVQTVIPTRHTCRLLGRDVRNWQQEEGDVIVITQPLPYSLGLTGSELVPGTAERQQPQLEPCSPLPCSPSQN